MERTANKFGVTPFCIRIIIEEPSRKPTHEHSFNFIRGFKHFESTLNHNGVVKVILYKDYVEKFVIDFLKYNNDFEKAKIDAKNYFNFISKIYGLKKAEITL